MGLELHLIANAHLDPVWLWDWREGLNEGLLTVRAVLDLMDEFPELTFIRGEAAIYRHIERTDGALFARLLRQVRAGRWDVVGGTCVQPDGNLPATETLARQFTDGLDYFRRRLRVRPTVAWQADSFGHPAGWPEILAAGGIDSFLFTRPGEKLFRLREPAFWWQAAGGARILAYQPQTEGYNTERDNMAARLDDCVEAAMKSGLETVPCLYGLGNHGGGPSRRHLLDIRSWAERNPGVRVVHSGLHRFFAALRGELKRKGGAAIPLHRGEVQFYSRGCYASVAKFKHAYRRGENLLLRAEMTSTAITALTGAPGVPLARAWDGLLFNTFHDILPGSSIERAYDDQLAWMGLVVHEAHQAEFTALTALARRVDTRVCAPPVDHPAATAVVVWNPHASPFDGHVEVEANLDYRPIWSYRGRAAQVPLRLLGPHGGPMPFQEIATEHATLPDLPWRKRVLAPVRLPAFGWTVLEFGWIATPHRFARRSPVRAGKNRITNGHYAVKASAGDEGVQILHRGRRIFSGRGLHAFIVEDPWGCWGGMADEPESVHLTAIRERWTVTGVTVQEQGPERASLWVRLQGRNSRLDLTFSVSRGREAVDISGRALWDERAARLKLAFPAGDRAEFEVPGGQIRRPADLGEVPGGRWVQIGPRSAQGFGFVSDSIYNFDCRDGALHATLVRATRYASDVPMGPKEDRWRPAVDSGELKFKFVLAPGNADLPKLARELERPPIVHLAFTAKGDLPRTGSVAALHPASLRLLALKPAQDGRAVVLRVQAAPGKTVGASMVWLGRRFRLGAVRGGAIASWRLTQAKSKWTIRRTDLSETETSHE